MLKLRLIPATEFKRVRASRLEKFEKLALLADMYRLNTLVTVKRAGSGHLGSSFSSLDVVTLLYEAVMNVTALGIRHPDRDIYFSSKGHDVPGLYAVLYGLGLLPHDQFIDLRRMDGTPGHPDICIPGIEANTGSLGMGISKAKGFAFAKHMRGQGGRIFVMTGDGELQEGQIYEALQTAAHQRLTNLNVIVDHNKVQSDKRVAAICDLGDLEAKFRAFGWHVARCDGHDLRELDRQLALFSKVTDKPKALIADTLKGSGVSFMEHPAALEAAGGVYRWHSGAPADQAFQEAIAELTERINGNLQRERLLPVAFEEMPVETRGGNGAVQENLADAYGQTLVALAAKNKALVVLDADLASDCRLRSFEAAYPERFIENGIAEQDLVSYAGGLALQGLLPVVNSFGAFLSARANEQIYNNATERKKVIYVCHYAGLLPAGPGHSHQSVRDIALFGSIPEFDIIQPGNAVETRMALEYCVEQAHESCMLRLPIGPSPADFALPTNYQFRRGRGAILADGRDAVIFAYGPVLLHQALVAAECLDQRGVRAKVVNMPWLNRANRQWLQEIVEGIKVIFVLDDHSPVGGLGDHLLDMLVRNRWWGEVRFRKLGVEGVPACGRAAEVLRYHGLDGASIAERLMDDLQVPCYARSAS